MRFTKMQGAGNDYVYVNGFCETVKEPEKLSVIISDRHFGIGADGLIILSPSQEADFMMQMYNADGSQGRMCGNGIRCAAALARREGIIKGSSGVVDTLAGKRTVFFKGNNVVVDMGAPVISVKSLPDISHIPTAYFAVKVDMGNPHFVVLVKNPAKDMAGIFGEELEKAPQFPDRANIEFVNVIDKEHIEISIWERGSGQTLSCGTGTCAAYSAARFLRLVGGYAYVYNPGGILKVYEDRGTCWLSGPAGFVYEGDWNP